MKTTWVVSLATVFIRIAFMGTPVQGDKGALYHTAKNVTYFINPAYAYTWYEAFMECSYRNMTLLTLDNDEQFQELHQLMITRQFVKKPPHLWIGAVGANRKFVWVSTGKPMITHLWGPGNPDNSANIENCVQIYENTKQLNDIKCAEKFGFVCGMRKVSGGGGDACDPDKAGKGLEKYRGLTFYFNQGKYSVE